MTPSQLVRHHEDANEFGGYFIINGIEKIVRQLILPKRNYVTAVVRQAFTKRGPSYTNFGTVIRCVRPDQSSVTVTCHYLNDGSCMIRFSIRKQEFFLPAVVLLKCLRETSDREIYDRIVQGDTQNTFVTDRVEMMLNDANKFGVYTKEQCQAFVGAKFRILLGLPSRYTDKEVCEYLLRQYVFVHLLENDDKYELLIFMIQKLYALVAGQIVEDNSDSLMNQELLVPGHLYLMYLKEKLSDFLNGIKQSILKDIRTDRAKVNTRDEKYFSRIVDRQTDIGRRVAYFMATGNLISESGLDLMQVTGYSVVADKLNALRYLAHFRSVHRGQFFAEMKTTTVRKLLPESWGFVCPVHTPDGAPCGLLNHLSATCLAVTRPTTISTLETLPPLLAKAGLLPIRGGSGIIYPAGYLTVMLDGVVVGKIPPTEAQQFCERIRWLKVQGTDGIPDDLEIAYIPPSEFGGAPFPGVFLATTPARLKRPVLNLRSGTTEWIGPMEQVYMSIACQDDDVREDTTHQELDPTNMLSILGSLVPFADFNQSPRNMYQCQMAKQTMGTPYHNHPHRADNKVYRIQNPQAPLVRNQRHVEFGMDMYPTGCNAVVAVISYTGYDMEDAMIINKSAYERGFGHGSVYKVVVHDLNDEAGKGEKNRFRFGNKDLATSKVVSDRLDKDGLPYVGTRLTKGDPLLCVLDHTKGTSRLIGHKDAEPAVVEEVRLLGEDKPGDLQKVSIKLRYNRNPVIGDKFSSRHGQKGVMSQLWPTVDMPFTENGITPDVIINPHAFPSRMTIGMLVESMAGKSGSLHAQYQDSTPFRFDENNRAVDHFGQQLVRAGYNYYGNETMYSGIFGNEMKADIYIGVVYYQRLRHMVSDKSQVRATGPIDQLTRQPVKGRKQHGGIRFGEMERDSLLAHGAAFLLHDRLMNCSDYSEGWVCTLCGSVLTPVSIRTSSLASSAVIRLSRGITAKRDMTCQFCETNRGCEKIAMPFVYRYLSNELAAMNIRMTVGVKTC
eukprot:GILJ01011653.1.p1 GENE.GILJ01011653.1~~GILJ01011653.1.p1  ORF type:complete len:1142 (+),score=150.84 GILJ01011653.1:411-3428(+)